MTTNEFTSLMHRATAITAGAYLVGYQRGLRRHYHGESFATPAEHDQWMSLGTGDDLRIDLGLTPCQERSKYET